MTLLKKPGTSEHPVHQASRDYDHAIAMLQKARAVELDTDDGHILVHSLEQEAESLGEENLRQIEALADGGVAAPAGRTLAHGQSLRGAITTPADVTLPDLVRGLALGRWPNTEPNVVGLLTSGVPAAVPGYASAGIIDLARDTSVIFRAGAKLMPIDTPSAKVARMTSMPAVQWEPEAANRDLADGAWTFDAAEITAKSAWLYTTLSIEAVEDCIDIDETIQRAFAAQLALAFDQGALAGDGTTDQPLGICNMGAVQDHIIEANNTVGVLADHRPFVRAMGAVKAAHHEPSSVILTPGLWTELACLLDLDTNPRQAPRAYEQLDEYVSSFLPSNLGVGTNEHSAIVGDLSALTVGVRTTVTIEVSRLGAGFKKGAVEVRGYCRFGTYLTRPGAIAILRGITLPAA